MEIDDEELSLRASQTPEYAAIADYLARYVDPDAEALAHLEDNGAIFIWFDPELEVAREIRARRGLDFRTKVIDVMSSGVTWVSLAVESKGRVLRTTELLFPRVRLH